MLFSKETKLGSLDDSHADYDALATIESRAVFSRLISQNLTNLYTVAAYSSMRQ